MPQPVCLISGVGPGTGAALARRFAAGGYALGLMARDEARIGELAAELGDAVAIGCDVADAEQVARAASLVEERFGPPEVVIHNAVGGAFGSFLDIDPAVLNQNFQVNTMGLLHLAQRLAPAMVAAGKGAILVTGNTSTHRGKADFAAFAPTKAAQRILAESMARDLGPKGVHVAYLVIDAIINLPWTHRVFNKDGSKPDSFFIQPSEIAEEVWHLAHQPRGAWSFNAEIRPFGEAW